MLVKFLARRVALLGVAAAAASLLLWGFLPRLLAGLLVGACIGVYKVRLNHRLLGLAVQGDAAQGKGLLLQMALQLVSFALLLGCALVDGWLFAGVAAGMLLTPLAICLNAFTEWAGLSHNCWGGDTA